MRVASFFTADRAGYGLVDADSVVDVSPVLGDRLPTLDRVLEAGVLDALPEAATRPGALRLALDEVTLTLPVSARRVFCIGVNYAAHREEMGRDEMPYPTVFVRFASSLVAHGAPIERPLASDRLDWEGELAVVIGRPGRRISRDDALAHVAGYACFLDGSVRDWQRHTTQFTAGKNFDRSGAFGPWLVSSHEIPDPSALTLTTYVNDVVMQQATTDLLIHDVPALVEYLSAVTELQPGDVIATGTPSGVGSARTPPIFLKPGDVVEVDISGVGTLRTPVVAEEA